MILRFSFVLVAAVGWISPRIEAAPLAPQGAPPSGLALPLQLVFSGEDPGANNQMGAAMEVAGNYLFIAAPGDGGGRVDVWYRGPLGYFFVQRLSVPAPLASKDDQFGRSLAADGDVLVVGARSSNNSGHAFVFRRLGNGLYSLEGLLAPSSGPMANSLFAERLAVLEDELVAVSARGQVAVHVFEADSNGRFPTFSTRILDQVSTGTTPTASWMTGFGSTVGLHRSPTGLVSLLVGMQDACFYQRTQQQAPDEVTPDPTGATAARTGGVAVLRKSGGAWWLDQRLVPDWSKMKDFGFEVDVDGPHVAVGAIYSRVNSKGFDAGTASVYTWDGSGFALVKTIWPSYPFQNGWFGHSVELRGDYLLVGQPQLWGGLQGLVEVFQITANDLLRVGLLLAPDGNPAKSQSSLGDSFGREIVSNSWGEVIVAAPFSAPGSGSSLYGGGALYLYR
jgi:hypothetical protein